MSGNGGPGALMSSSGAPPLMHHPPLGPAEMMFQQFPHAGGDHMTRPPHFPTYMQHWPGAAAPTQQHTGEMPPRFMLHPQFMQYHHQLQLQQQLAHQQAVAAQAAQQQVMLLTICRAVNVHST